RLAVVVARLRGARALEAEPEIALEHRRLRGLELQVERERLARDARAIAATRARERPVVDPHVRVGDGSVGEAFDDARRTLVGQQPRLRRIGERRMGEEELPGAEAAGI